MCTGWHACAVYIYHLSIAYRVFSCDVSPLYQEQGTDVVTAFTGCTVQCSDAILQQQRERDRQREIGQVRGTQRRMGMVQGQAGRVR